MCAIVHANRTASRTQVIIGKASGIFLFAHSSSHLFSFAQLFTLRINCCWMQTKESITSSARVDACKHFAEQLLVVLLLLLLILFLLLLKRQRQQHQITLYLGAINPSVFHLSIRILRQFRLPSRFYMMCACPHSFITLHSNLVHEEKQQIKWKEKWGRKKGQRIEWNCVKSDKSIKDQAQHTTTNKSFRSNWFGLDVRLVCRWVYDAMELP